MPATAEAFLAYIRTYVPLSQEEWTEVERVLVAESLPAGEMLLREGQICRYLYFVEEGLLRFVTDRAGEEVTKFFTVAPYCFTAQRSFRDGLPSGEGIVAIEDCRLWKMPRNEAYRLLELPGWGGFIRELIQEVQFRTEDIMTEQRTRSAEDRYLALLRSDEGLVQRVPLKMLASYLGIAPQSLSRIRRRLSGPA